MMITENDQFEIRVEGNSQLTPLGTELEEAFAKLWGVNEKQSLPWVRLDGMTSEDMQEYINAPYPVDFEKPPQSLILEPSDLALDITWADEGAFTWLFARKN